MSSMNCAMARSSRASGPHITAKRDFASFAARSMSSRPSASPTSSCALGLKSNRRGVPQRRTSTFSSSLLPGGTDGWGRFGTWASSVSIASSTAFTSASSALMRSPTSRIRACSALASWPALRARPMVSEAVLRWALRSSASLMRRRRSTSLARISGMSWAPPFWASARCTSSGRSRISRRSSTALRRFGGGGGLGLDASDRADLVVGVEVDDAHTHRVAPLRRDVVGVDADRFALGLASALGNFVHLEPVHLAEVGKEEQVGVGGGDEEVFDDVLFFRLHARDALAPATLAAVGLDVRALDVARARDGDDHLLVGQEVLDRQLRRLGEDLGAPRVAVFLLDGAQLVLDDPHQLDVGREDALELLDELQDLFVLFDDLLSLERGQATQLHVEDGLGLDLAELQSPHQGVAGGVGAGRLADDADDDVELLDGLSEARQD